jgi:hypothetical protein
MDQWGFHKDTKGQTLFVNLNYHMNQEIVGPEFVRNPPLLEAHEQQIAESLPIEFVSDLRVTRPKADPTEIAASVVPAYGFVAFVDEAIHHATPLYGHRFVKGGEFKAFLMRNHPDEFAEAQGGYEKFKAAGWWAWSRYWPFWGYLEKKAIKEADSEKWLKWMKMTDEPAKDVKARDRTSSRPG